jgi:hypothetical protein
VFHTKTTKENFVNVKSNIISAKEITSFLGNYIPEGINILNMKFGELIELKEMEYRYAAGNVFLRTRRGTSLILDITLKSAGAVNFINGTTNYFVWVDVNGDMNYYDGANINLILAGNDTNNHEFVVYNLASSPTVYGVNTAVGLYKINSLLGYSVIKAITGATCVEYCSSAQKLFFAAGNKLYHSNQQVKNVDNTTNLETFSVDPPIIGPDNGTGIETIKDTGQLLMIWKDTGVWCVANPEQDVADWYYPQHKVNTGTKSPKTVRYGKYGEYEGFIFLGSDKTLRFITASVTKNSGDIPTLVDKDSLTISNTFQKYLDEIPDDYLPLCNAVFFEGYYILNLVSRSGTEIDHTIIVDTGKLTKDKQPYWFYSTSMNFNWYMIRNNRELYGVHISGWISRLFVEDQYYDEQPYRGETPYAVYDDDYLDVANNKWLVAIHWSWYTGWMKISKYECRLYDGYLHWETEGRWDINFVVNSFTTGDEIPYYTNGSVAVLNPKNIGGSYFDYSFFYSAYWMGNTMQTSQNFGQEAYGNHFLFGGYGNKRAEWASIFGIEHNYQILKSSPMGANN